MKAEHPGQEADVRRFGGVVIKDANVALGLAMKVERLVLQALEAGIGDLLDHRITPGDQREKVYSILESQPDLLGPASAAGDVSGFRFHALSSTSGDSRETHTRRPNLPGVFRTS